jgi:hypothetical protein
MTWFKRSTPIPTPPAPRQVRLHWTKSDGAELAMDGFLVGLTEGHYVLRRASLVTGALDVEPLEGTVEIPAHRVEFVQDLT